MAGDNGNYYSNADNSIVNVETGGVLRVRGSVYIGHDGRKGTLNFNGGTLEWANSSSGQFMSGETYKSQTRAGLKFNLFISCSGSLMKISEGLGKRSFEAFLTCIKVSFICPHT